MFRFPFLLVAFTVVVIASYFPVLARLGAVPSNGWDYFNSLSLIMRSNVLNYHAFPAHNPWLCGGLDLWANPLSRIFSPLGLFDTLFFPPVALTLGWLFCTFFGLVGMYLLLRQLSASFWASVVGAIFFVNANWFAHHLGGGHIPFGSMQLMPLVLYCVLQLQEKKYRLYLTTLLILFLLDGGIPTFLFSLFLTLSCFAFGFEGMKWRWFNKPATDWFHTLFLLVVFVLLAGAKLIPFFYQLPSERAPELMVLSARAAAFAFFYPFHQIQLPALGIEKFGCYLGVVGLLLIFASFFRHRFFRKNHRVVWLFLFWLWVGTGWFYPINPWRLFQLIPIFHDVSVQSHAFILMFIFFIVLLVRALDRLKPTPLLQTILVAWLLAESFFVHGYPLVKLTNSMHRNPYYRQLVTGRHLMETILYGKVPEHYFDPNKGSQKCDEPFQRGTGVRHSAQQGYRGEIYMLKGEGEAKLTEYTPGRITIDYEGAVPAQIGVNTNYLAGWLVFEGDVEPWPDKDNLLALNIKKPKDHIVIKYRPFYFYPIMVLFCFGVFLLGVAFIWQFAGSFYQKAINILEKN